MQKRSIKISVIVPVYNAQKYLNRCLDSILNQTYRNLEIILINDGSTDDSEKIMEEYARQDNRVSIYCQTHNMGLVRARKTGVGLATGNYISYVDADDEISLTRYEELLSQMKIGAEIIVTDVVQIYSADSRYKMPNYFHEGIYGTKEIQSEILTKITDIDHFHKRYLRTYVCGAIFSRVLLQRCQNLVADEITVGEDAACFLWCLLHARSLVIIAKGTYYYYKHDGSMCHISSFDLENRKKMRKSHAAFEIFAHDYIKHVPELIRSLVCKQLLYECYYLRIVSDYHFLMERRDKMSIFPFGISVFAKVVIYGAGSFGQQLYEYWSGQEATQILAWCDNAYARFSALEATVLPPEEILTLNPDYVLMAIAQYDVAIKAGEALIEMGVEREKIKYVTVDEFR